jgi:predicted NUDIX family NTP pyrophosphohydrolase
MARQNSAGILLYREAAGGVEMLLVHPGGPFWAKKDDAAWSIPKGLYDEGEAPLAAARREFAEETGMVPAGEFIDLGEFRQAGGKRISAFALRGDFDPAQLKSNLFSLEWPPKSGKLQEFPEVDRAAWFDTATALRKATKGQVAIILALLDRLGLPAPATFKTDLFD